MSVRAGVVKAWGNAPVYDSIDLPAPSADQVRVRVLGAAVHNLVRSRAAGEHFSMIGKNPPHVPGTDGVGIIPETNQLVYFNSLLSPTGSLAQETNIGKRDVFPLPEGADPDTIAVLVNPAMSSWMAFTTRAGVQPGTGIKVAIVGATGVSGQTAVQISKAFGASEIITIGKPGPKLEKTKELGATALVPLAENLTETDFSAAADVDVVLDYLWGDVSSVAFAGIINARKNKSQRLNWVEIGALAGENQAIPASLLRMANVALLGCAPGSWTFPELNAQMPAMLDALVKGNVKTEFVVKKLEDVESWWNETGGARPLAKP
jgi:NADPH:quinone reductase-like Zn-dependent oxidoreductase